MPYLTTHHFVTGYDSGINWEEWSVKLYGDNKCIVAAEHLKSNAHVHFHGESPLNDKEWTKVFNQFCADHPVKKIPGAEKLRPTRESKKVTDKMGYQYCAKENHILYKQEITDEELEELRDASKEHADKLKNSAKDHVHAKKYEGAPADILDKLGFDYWEYCTESGIAFRPQFRCDVIRAMNTHPDATVIWRRYLYSVMMKK